MKNIIEINNDLNSSISDDAIDPVVLTEALDDLEALLRDKVYSGLAKEEIKGVMRVLEFPTVDTVEESINRLQMLDTEYKYMIEEE